MYLFLYWVESWENENEYLVIKQERDVWFWWTIELIWKYDMLLNHQSLSVKIHTRS